MQNQFSTVEETLNQLVNGSYIILADNGGRENESDSAALGENANAGTIYEVLNKANGSTYVPISEDIAKHLASKPTVEHSTGSHQASFVVTTDDTLEAASITADVSAFGHTVTIRRIVKLAAQASNFNYLGHIQPLYAQPRGLRDRTGHTEATIDPAYLVGKAPVAVITEVLRRDSTMVRRDSLLVLANRVHVPFIIINQIIEYLDVKGIDYTAGFAEVNT